MVWGRKTRQDNLGPERTDIFFVGTEAEYRRATLEPLTPNAASTTTSAVSNPTRVNNYRSNRVVVQTDTASVTPARISVPFWPVPKAATKISADIWTMSLTGAQSSLRPDLHFNKVIAYRIISHDTAGIVTSGPAMHLLPLGEMQPRWRPLLGSMALGELKRIWIVDSGGPPIIYDVRLIYVLNAR